MSLLRWFFGDRIDGMSAGWWRQRAHLESRIDYHGVGWSWPVKR